MSNSTSMHLRVILILILLVGIFGITPRRAGAEAVETTRQDCEPNSGWMWVNGPLKPEISARVQQELAQKGINALVEARSYGEVDSCGTYSEHGVDFKINLRDTGSTYGSSQQELVDTILQNLKRNGRPNLGNIRLISPQGESIPVNVGATETNLSTAQALNIDAAATDPIIKRVYVIVYDPLLSNGQTLSQYAGWNNHSTITQQTVDFFNTSTNGRFTYSIVDTSIVTSGWPELLDGFIYTESTFLPVLTNPSLHHEPTEVNYNKIVNSPEFDICGRVDRGEVDEVWVYNGPWFGFYESTLVGPGAYPMNSNPVGGSHTCNKLVPIMGPSVERTVDEAVHNFTHRTEDTMKKVYGSWQENNTSHSWNKFALVKAQSPNYSYSGCGSSHYPPNGVTDYDYGNALSVLSNCDDFANYPNLSDPLVVSQPVACTRWGCNQLGYFQYWFGHFPVATGCGPDNVANDWWRYLTNPGIALYPSYACQADMHMISGNAGAGGVTLSYTDGSARYVMSDSYGNYFLFVSNHWTGTITPSRAGYTFSPTGKSYADVQNDLYNQDYSSQGTGAPAFYVNIATGDNNNSCTLPSTPCRTIQETINKANAGDIIYVTSGTYLFSTNGSPNVAIINKDLTLSGGWNADFTSQAGASTIDGANVNNGILIISGTVKVENFIIERSTSFNSGAVYIVTGNVTINRSTLRNNHASSNGAGIFVDSGTLKVVNSTISGNQANSMGGGIYAANNAVASVTIQNSTIVYNNASTGGGISRTNGTYNITNTILANNIVSSSSPDCYGTIAAANFNIIENMTGCSISSGSNNLNVDPQVDSNLTGVMPVHVLLSTSPAINTGTASGCPAIDQIGTTRPQGISCDIGAYEYSGPINIPTDTPTNTPMNTPTPTNTFTPTATPPYSHKPLYLSLTGNQTIGGVASSDEDILQFDGQTWSLFFDGSDVGVGTPDLFAFSLLDPDSLLMAFSGNVTVNGITATPQDVLRFDATSLGSTTAGTFSLYFDGSDVGLSTSSESIDALSLLPDGRLLISTTGDVSVPGLTTSQDEDVLAFTPTSLNANTSGTWSMYFDGSDVGLADNSNEDVDAVDVTSNGYVYLSTLGDFTVNGLTGADEDVFICMSSSLGSVTACNYSSSLYFDGSTWGLSTNDVDAFHFIDSGSNPTATATVTSTPTSGPTPTFTNTPTATPTGTSGPTSTPTDTPTATPTSTSGPTSTPTNTPTATATSTPTSTPTNTPTATSTSTSTATLPAGTILTLYPIDDAYIASTYPTTNYGSAKTLQVNGNPLRHVLIKFELSGLSGQQIASIKLRLYNVNASNLGGDFYRVGDNSWQEETIIWNNAPASLNDMVAALGSVSANNWYEVDVTPLIAGNGTYSFLITSTSTDGADYASKESAYPPQLVITFR